MASTFPVTVPNAAKEIEIEPSIGNTTVKVIIRELDLALWRRWLRYAKVALGGISAIAVGLLIAFAIMGNTHHRRVAEDLVREAREPSPAYNSNSQAVSQGVPAGLANTRWEGSIKLQDGNIRKFDQTGRFLFHDRTVDIDTYAVHIPVGMSRIGCAVLLDVSDLLISCNRAAGSLMPETYRLKPEATGLTGIMVVYCNTSPADSNSTCPESGMLFYDVALKRMETSETGDTDLAQEMFRRWQSQKQAPPKK